MSTYTGFGTALLTGQGLTDKVFKEMINLLSNKTYVILDNLAKELNALFNEMAGKNKYDEMCIMHYTHNNSNTIVMNANIAKNLYSNGGSFEYMCAMSGVNPEDMLDLLREEVDEDYMIKLIKVRPNPNNTSPEMMETLYGITLSSTNKEADTNPPKNEDDE